MTVYRLIEIKKSEKSLIAAGLLNCGVDGSRGVIRSKRNHDE